MFNMSLNAHFLHNSRMGNSNIFDYILLIFASYYFFKMFLAGFDFYMGHYRDQFSIDFEERLKIYHGIFSVWQKPSPAEAAEQKSALLLNTSFEFNRPDHLILNVSYEAGPRELKMAYHKLAKLYHPDQFIGSHDFDENHRQFLNKRFARIKLAYENLLHKKV